MSSMTIAEFVNFLARNDWERHQFSRVFDEKQKIGGTITTFSLKDDDEAVIRCYKYVRIGADERNYKIDGTKDTYSIGGVSVVDNCGNELSENDLINYLPPEFSEIDYEVFLNKRA